MPIVESENDVSILLCFGEVDVGLVGDEEIGETGIVGDAFIEESFLVGGATVGLVFRENKDAGDEIGSGGGLEECGNRSREVD
jgi:hypothetical protein